MLVMRADRSEFAVELTITRITQDGPTLFTGYLRDITERKQAEAALYEHQALLKLILGQMPARLWTTDKDLRITSATGTVYREVALDLHERIGKTGTVNLSVDHDGDP